MPVTNVELLKLGLRIKSSRKVLGRNQKDFSKQCGLDRSYFGILEFLRATRDRLDSFSAQRSAFNVQRSTLAGLPGTGTPTSQQYAAPKMAIVGKSRIAAD